MAAPLVDVPAKAFPQDLGPITRRPGVSQIVFRACSRRRKESLTKSSKPFGIPGALTIVRCLGFGLFFPKACQHQSTRFLVRSSPLVSIPVHSCHIQSCHRTEFAKTHGIIVALKVTGIAFRCSAGFLTCRIANFQSADLLHWSKPGRGVPFSKLDKTEQNRTEMPGIHYTNYQNNRRGTGPPPHLASLRLRAFALKSSLVGVAQTNFDCKLSIMTITSPSTTKGK